MELICKTCGKKFERENDLKPYINGLNTYCSMKCAQFSLYAIKEES